MKIIEIYGRRGCVKSAAAVLACETRGYRFVYRDVADNADCIDCYRRNPQTEDFPQIFVGDIHVGSLADLTSKDLDGTLHQIIGG